MNKIICNSVDFVFRNEIKTMKPGEAPVLIDTALWKKINVTEQPVYQSSVKQSDAGPTNEETVTARARHNNIVSMLIEYCGFYVVLRLSTDEKTFYTGTIDYPCTIEYTSDQIFDNYTFKAISPA